MKFSKIGLALAVLYLVVASIVALQDFNCGGGLDMNICGLGTIFITFPSFVTVGRLFTAMGLVIDFRNRSPSVSDLAQLATHIAICAALVYLVGHILERLVVRLFRGVRHSVK